MKTKYFKSFIAFVFIPHLFFAQNINDDHIISILDKIDSLPISISFKNSLKINNNGGHIQGIQYIKYKKNDYYILSGSSDSYSYFSILKDGNKNKVISVNKILNKPYKHAGGFQIYDHLMAIGIEDNSLRNKSKVFIYSIANPENPSTKPLSTIERIGVTKRATAGCVAITEISDFILVVVGDWDTKNLDFYRIKKEKLGMSGEGFELVFSIEIKKMDKSEWIDKSWLAYQNINFIKDSSGYLYLAGMTSNSKKNILDLFKVQTNDFKRFNLVKIYTKRLSLNDNSNFRWAAGINVSDDNKLKIISCGSHIQQESKINIYK